MQWVPWKSHLQDQCKQTQILDPTSIKTQKTIKHNVRECKSCTLEPFWQLALRLVLLIAGSEKTKWQVAARPITKLPVWPANVSSLLRFENAWLMPGASSNCQRSKKSKVSLGIVLSLQIHLSFRATTKMSEKGKGNVASRIGWKSDIREVAKLQIVWQFLVYCKVKNLSYSPWKDIHHWKCTIWFLETLIFLRIKTNDFRKFLRASGLPEAIKSSFRNQSLDVERLFWNAWYLFPCNQRWISLVHEFLGKLHPSLPSIYQA